MSGTTLIGEKLGSRSSGVGDQYMQWRTAVYYVQANRASISSDTIMDTPGLPKYRGRHPFYPRAFVTSIEPRAIPESDNLWEVAIRWESRPWQRQEDDLPPWERSAVINDSPIAADRSYLHDLDGKAYINTAGDPFIPQPTRQTSDLQITIERAQLEYDRIESMKWADVVNADIWWGFPRYAARLARPVVTDGYWNHIPYHQFTYSLHVLGGCFADPPELWIPTKILNQGSACLRWDEVNAQYVHEWCKKNNVEATEPQLLNQDGTQMTKEEVEAVGPVFLEFRDYEAKPFSELFPEV